VKTLQRWDRDKILVAKRTPTDRRYYTYDQYLEFKGVSNDSNTKKKIIYTRVSTNNQKDNLKNQVKFLLDFANAKGIIIDEVIEDIGSGLNYNRKKWNKLIEHCMENKIDSIMVTHKDRFIRFGYEWFERFLGKYDVKIIVVNNETLSPNEELVQDIISILHVFSCKIYGMRKYKKKIEEDEEIAKSIQNGNKSNREPKTKD
jgi:predicted site-specific integrase-resolvase